MHQDLADPEAVRALVANHDLVVNAVPGFMGFKPCRRLSKPARTLWISRSTRRTRSTWSPGQGKGVTAVVDCGVAPGMSNLLIGHVHEELDRTDSILIYVGGLPETRRWPFEYRAVFSPIDVIAEYTRPARYVENGKLVILPPFPIPNSSIFPASGPSKPSTRTASEPSPRPSMPQI